MKQAPVRIANPVIGGHTYTSGKRALMFIRRDEAVLLLDGSLWFSGPPEKSRGANSRGSIKKSNGIVVVSSRGLDRRGMAF